MRKPLPRMNILGLFQSALVALLIIACIKIIMPFLGAILWAAVIAVSTWPLYCRLQNRLNGRRNWAALIVVVLLMLALAIPITFMILAVAETLPHLSDLSHSLTRLTLPATPSWIQKLPIIGGALDKLWESTRVDLPGFFLKIRPAVNDSALWLLSKGANLGISFAEIILAILIAGLFLINGERLLFVLNKIIIRIAGKPAGTFMQVIARTIRSVTTGIIGTALAQTLLCEIGLFITGVPGALLLGILCFIIAIAQLPTLIIWLPAAGWLFYQGETGWAIFLVIWGFLLINTIDNFLKPLLISQGTQLPLSIIFLGVLGGLLAWGMIGLFLGPTLLAVGISALRHWLRDEEEDATDEDHTAT